MEAKTATFHFRRLFTTFVFGVISMQEIIVRHSESEDIPGIKAIFEGKEIYSNTLQLPYSSIKVWESQFENPQAGYYSLVAELNGEIVGHTGLKIDQNPARKHVGSCGIAVKDSHHRKGIGGQDAYGHDRSV